MATADLTRNAVDVLPEGELEQRLELGRPLRVKLGIDATSPDIHLGFAFVLERLAVHRTDWGSVGSVRKRGLFLPTK